MALLSSCQQLMTIPRRCSRSEVNCLMIRRYQLNAGVNLHCIAVVDQIKLVIQCQLFRLHRSLTSAPSLLEFCADSSARNARPSTACRPGCRWRSLDDAVGAMPVFLDVIRSLFRPQVQLMSRP